MTSGITLSSADITGRMATRMAAEDLSVRQAASAMALDAGSFGVPCRTMACASSITLRSSSGSRGTPKNPCKRINRPRLKVRQSDTSLRQENVLYWRPVCPKFRITQTNKPKETSHASHTESRISSPHRWFLASLVKPKCQRETGKNFRPVLRWAYHIIE
jgi:hypothetical protein